jgi:hypothetical protein
MICGVVATSISGCVVCTVCRVVCDPEDGPIGPKHVGANIEIF